MAWQSKLAISVLILATLACNPVGGAPSSGGAPSPTPPPIPTRPLATPTLGPTPTQAEEVVPESQQMGFVFGSTRGPHMGLFMLGVTGEFVSGVTLDENTLNATWPAPSPDGTKLAFVSEQSDLLINGIFVLNLETGTTTQLTQGDGIHPQWSRDGSRIAYTCNTGGTSIGLQNVATDVCVINSDGSSQANLTADSAGLDAYPSWTSDGRIVFMSSRDLATSGLFAEIYVMNGDGSGITALTADKKVWNAAPSVSSDGTRIAYESNREVGVGSEIYTMDLDGSKTARVTNDKVWNQNPVWSPDGSKLLFAKGGADGNVDLYQINTDGSNEFRLTQSPAEDGGLRLGHAWLPAARVVEASTVDRETANLVPVALPSGSSEVSNKILFAASNFNCPDCLPTGIYAVDFSGANLAQIPGINGIYPTWSPDFTRIAFVQDGEIHIANADGSDPVTVTHASVNLSSIQWSGSGSQLLATCQPFGQFDTCLVEPVTGAIHNLTENITIGSGLPNASWVSADRILVGQVVLDLVGVQVGSTASSGRASPDGTKLAFISSRQLNVGAFPDGGGALKLTSESTTKGFPVWSPDGTLIFYSTAAGDGKIFLWGVRADGVNGPYPLVTSPISVGPTQRPTSIDSWLGYSWAP